MPELTWKLQESPADTYWLMLGGIYVGEVAFFRSVKTGFAWRAWIMDDDEGNPVKGGWFPSLEEAKANLMLAVEEALHHGA